MLKDKPSTEEFLSLTKEFHSIFKEKTPHHVPHAPHPHDYS